MAISLFLLIGCSQTSGENITEYNKYVDKLIDSEGYILNIDTLIEADGEVINETSQFIEVNKNESDKIIQKTDHIKGINGNLDSSEVLFIDGDVSKEYIRNNKNEEYTELESTIKADDCYESIKQLFVYIKDNQKSNYSVEKNKNYFEVKNDDFQLDLKMYIDNDKISNVEYTSASQGTYNGKATTMNQKIKITVKYSVDNINLEDILNKE